MRLGRWKVLIISKTKHKNLLTTSENMSARLCWKSLANLQIYNRHKTCFPWFVWCKFPHGTDKLSDINFANKLIYIWCMEKMYNNERYLRKINSNLQNKHVFSDKSHAYYEKVTQDNCKYISRSAHFNIKRCF